MNGENTFRAKATEKACTLCNCCLWSHLKLNIAAVCIKHTSSPLHSL